MAKMALDDGIELLAAVESVSENVEAHYEGIQPKPSFQPDLDHCCHLQPGVASDSSALARHLSILHHCLETLLLAPSPFAVSTSAS